MKEGLHVHPNPDEKKALKERFRFMTPEHKLKIAVALNHDARKLKAAALRKFHPDWDEARIQEEIKKIFLYAHT